MIADFFGGKIWKDWWENLETRRFPDQFSTLKSKLPFQPNFVSEVANPSTFHPASRGANPSSAPCGNNR